VTARHFFMNFFLVLSEWNDIAGCTDF